jgi:hypothetical protein
MDTVKQEVVDGMRRAEDTLLLNEAGATVVPRSTINSWRFIDVKHIQNNESRRVAHRLNSFASLYYFATQVLRKNKLQTQTDIRKNLHFQMCQMVMKDGLKEVIEIPRDHYKSTIYSECFPIWRSLPFDDEDAELMLRAGMRPLYIEWMRRAHKRDLRTLLVSETLTNAVKLGVKIGNHYKNGKYFTAVFPEIIPDTSCTWAQASLHHKRTEEGSSHGEGTYDFIGVGGALQSRHYDMVVQDDLVGKDAIYSETVMASTIEYHKLLVGAFDSDVTNAGRDNDEIVVGNRWSYDDLNSYIRENENYFNFATHSALGGCCALHEVGVPIFPEAFNDHKLAIWKRRLGTYHFSCQFLNFPINPAKCKFKKENLRYFHYERDSSAFAYNPNRIDEDSKKTYRIKIRHHVQAGDVEEDIFPRNLQRYMVIDPAHANQDKAQIKRCRHAITVTGVNEDPRRIYLLNAWAEACSYNDFVAEIFKQAIAFKINKIHIETVAAQKYLKFHLEYYIQVNKYKMPEIANIKFVELKSSTASNAKFQRIDAFVPVTERGEFWVNAVGSEKFMEEYEAYGNKNGLLDILDTLGYGTQVWQFDNNSEEDLANFLNAQKQRFIRSNTLRTA